MAEAVGLRVDDPRFWDAEDLRREIDRVFDICHGCRLCFKFCGSFPTLFEAIDTKTEVQRRAYLRAHPELVAEAAAKRAAGGEAPESEVEGEVGITYGDELPQIQAGTRDLTREEIDRVVDLCFQCKLCYQNCPYTPPHEFAVDFPRLLLRWRAHRVRERGISWRARILRETTWIGRLASTVPGLSNWALRNPVNRRVMEKLLGIHRRKLMPTYSRETFPRWWRRHRPAVDPPAPPREGVEPRLPLRVVLFSTCLIDYNDPECGRAAVAVLEHNGVEVVRPEAQDCCGMPCLDDGDVEAARRRARHNLRVLGPGVEQGRPVVVPSPSCSLMLREEYPQLLGPEAQALAEATMDLGEYLYRLAREGRLKRDFVRRLGSVRYHVPCHLRVQNIGIRSRDLLRLVADEVEVVQECSGHDGTWSMQRAHFEDSLHWGRKAMEAIRGHRGPVCADCRLAALHLRQGAGVESVHPIVALAYAYGFDVRVPGAESADGSAAKP